MTVDEYISQVEKFFLAERGSFSFLSAKDIQTVEHWYKENVPLEVITETLSNELKKYPPRKRKKVPLFIFEKKILEEHQKRLERKKHITKNSVNDKWRTIVDELKLNPDILNIPENYKGDISLLLEERVIREIWNKLSKEKKQELIDFAKRRLKSLNLKPEEKQEYLKDTVYSLIKEQLQKRYNI